MPINSAKWPWQSMHKSRLCQKPTFALKFHTGSWKAQIVVALYIYFFDLLNMSIRFWAWGFCRVITVVDGGKELSHISINLP